MSKTAPNAQSDAGRSAGAGIEPVAPLGTSKGWKSDAALLKDLTRSAAEPIDPGSPPAQRFANLRAYARGDNPFSDLIDPSQPRRGPLAAAVADCLWGDPAVLARWALPMLQGEPVARWRADFAQLSAYAYWRWRIKFRAQGSRGRVFLEVPASVMGSCLYLGWMEEARIVAETIRRAYAERLVANVSGPGCQPLNHFLLRVAFDYWDMPFDGWGKGHNPRLDPKLDPRDIFGKNECFGQPVLNLLHAHWRDADLGALTDHLLWAADYSTHRLNTDCEFAWGGPLAARMPGVLLPFARLRACLGLAMPAVAHPLLAAPYATLPAPGERYTDPLLEQVLDRLAREEWPGLLD